ncbi:helix-turn-helix transcriptional regulator [Amycolatopsis albispora]|uniref:Helix-turn-helix transcriptional regulator n=1 Tax=Amycolatopsis albispora TaxID=1804986 RepID=A0A344LK52_9PSEU|nr:response regulator transcription factor [Amycolatopsis albispora]AXB48426.1 helix-turn-helix transcriptional regulator [Amycolatopsis albispora]
MPAPPGKPALRAVPSAVRVAVLAADPFVLAGVSGELKSKPGVHLVDNRDGRDSRADVVVAVPDGTRKLHEVLAGINPEARVVLVADDPRPAELLTAVEHGLAVLLPRKEATTARLLHAINDAYQGRGALPAEQLGELLKGVTRLQREVLEPRDLTLSGLSRRETDVLRLLAEGRDTAEIAAEMAYSERTVKNILHGLLTRLDLRNRTHAVAHALRLGLI